MSLVTSQGLKARSNVDAAIDRVRNELLAEVTKRDLELSEAFRIFADDSEQTVREAVWRLLNDRQVEVTSGTRLRSLHA